MPIKSENGVHATSSWRPGGSLDLTQACCLAVECQSSCLLNARNSWLK